MRRLWPALSTLFIALWLGSLAHTLLTVATLFRAFPKDQTDVAMRAAPVVFAATERLHLALAVLAVMSVLLWRRVACSRWRRLVSYALFAATLLAVVQIAGISPRMDALRVAGESSGSLFKRLHGVSSVQYLLQTACLLVATLLLPSALDDGACDTPKDQ